MSKHSIVIITAAISLGALFNLASPTNTHADAITDIAGFTELNECYTNGTMKSDIGTITSGLNTSQLYSGDGDGKAHIPNMWNNTIADGDLSCDELIRGYNRATAGGNGGGKWTRLVGQLSTIDATGGSQKVDRDKAIPWLKKMGYKAKSSGGNTDSKQCKNIDYMKKTGTSYADARKKTGTLVHTHEICAEGLSNGKTTNSTTFSVNKNGVAKITQISVDNSGHKISFHDGGVGPFKTTYGDIDVSAGASWKNDIVQGFYDIMKSKRSSVEETEGQQDWKTYIVYEIKMYDPTAGLDDGGDDDNYDEINGNWVFDGGDANAAKIAISQNSSYSSVADLKFTEQQKSQLHQHYFKNYFKAKLICEGDADYDTLTATDDTVKADNVTSKSCYAKAEEPTPKHNKYKPGKVNAIKPDLTWHTQYTFKELVANMTEEELLGANTATDPGDENSEGAERDPDCQTKAGALGWILCPIIDIASNMVEQVYTDMIQPYLSIDAALFDTNEPGGKAVREVWAIFQGFANLAFVILFLVVIFSQLTGVGIDNYGIKKILPKLIIGAVLINMSYIICQLAVDLSNILGRAIGGLFQTVADDINSTLSGMSVNLYPDQAADVSGKFSSVGTNASSGSVVLVIVGIAAALGIGAFLAAGPAIILPVILALISVVIGIFFLFALLALRQAVAVILVVVSPMAFAMYMLPNTKKIFDKWFQTFKGMLVAYPIASALVFGGDLVSKILLVASGGTRITSLGLLLSAAVVAVAPIFFIPSVIRKSMGALSGISNIMQRGQQRATNRLRTGATNRVQNSGLQRYVNQRNERRRAGINSKGELTTRGKLQNRLPRTAGGRANLAEARQKALGYVSADNTNRRMLTKAGVAAASAGITAKAAQQAINDEIMNMADDTKNYNVDVMEKQLASYMSQESLSTDDEARAKALMTKLSQSGGDGNKRLIGIMSGKYGTPVSGAGKKLFTEHATNTDIANNMGNKDAYMAQYLRDTQAGFTDKSFNEWLRETNTNGRGVGVSNAEFVATKQLDDDERLMQQSGDSLKLTVDGLNGVQGGGWVSADRAQRILDNDNINKKQDQIDRLEGTGAKMRTQVNPSGSGGGGGGTGGSGGGTGGSGGGGGGTGGSGGGSGGRGGGSGGSGGGSGGRSDSPGPSNPTPPSNPNPPHNPTPPPPSNPNPPNNPPSGGSGGGSGGSRRSGGGSGGSRRSGGGTGGSGGGGTA